MNKINEESALIELESFVNHWAEKPVKNEELKDSYSNILEAICSGNLVINENKEPVYTLLSPIKNDKGEVSVSELNFKTRILPNTQASLSKGIDISKEQLRFMLICIAHIIGQPIQMLDKFSKKDYNTIREVATVFI
jgi:hypothetical protein